MSELQKPSVPTMPGVSILDAEMSIEYPMWEMMIPHTGLIERGHTGQRIYGFDATYSCPMALSVEFEDFLRGYMDKGVVRFISKEIRPPVILFKVKGKVSDYVEVRDSERQASSSRVRPSLAGN